jgi:CubicO group peptidase (beta-lactamase class C family)
MTSILASILALVFLGPGAEPNKDVDAAPPRVAAFLEAIRTGDPAATLRFVRKEFDETDLKRLPAEPRAQRLARIGREHPGLAFVRVLQDSPRVLRWLARDQKNQYLEIAFELSPAPAHGIMGVDLDPAEESTGAPVQARATDAEAAAAARQWLDELSAKDQFSGSVLLARDGKIFFEGAWGMADRERKIANRPDTSYNLASIGKVFTQVAIAQLAAKGKLALTDTISKHLPDLPVPSAEKITIQQLFKHTSGMGDIFGDKYFETPPASLKRLSDYIPFFANVPLQFSPGEGNSYSNAGYVVLGLIVEKLSGKEFHEYVRENIFVPAGMKDSGPYEPQLAVAKRAVGYTRRAPGGGNAPQPITGNLPARNSSAGGSRSTAPDLLRFDQALRQDRLLPKNWTDWFFFNKPGSPPKSPGEATGRGGSLAIAGGSPGVSTAMDMNLDTGTTIIVLANQDPQISERVLSRLRQWLPKPAKGLSTGGQ